MSMESQFWGQPFSFWRELQERADKNYPTGYEDLLKEIIELRVKVSFYESRIAQLEAKIASWLHDGRLQTFGDRERVRAEMRACLALETSVKSEPPCPVSMPGGDGLICTCPPQCPECGYPTHVHFYDCSQANQGGKQ